MTKGICHPEPCEGSRRAAAGFFGRGAQAPLGQNDIMHWMLGTPYFNYQLCALHSATKIDSNMLSIGNRARFQFPVE
jgi:hypothetical protein